MIEKIKFPVYAYETETGDVYTYNNIDQLRLMVEEFWDILEIDFTFRDREGSPLVFGKDFLDGNDD